MVWDGTWKMTLKIIIINKKLKKTHPSHGKCITNREALTKIRYWSVINRDYT